MQNYLFWHTVFIMLSTLLIVMFHLLTLLLQTLRQFEFYVLSLENSVMTTLKCCLKLFLLIFILKCFSLFLFLKLGQTT